MILPRVDNFVFMFVVLAMEFLFVIRFELRGGSLSFLHLILNTHEVGLKFFNQSSDSFFILLFNLKYTLLVSLFQLKPFLLHLEVAVTLLP